MVCCLLARPALAQSRPLVTEDPETVPAGNLLLEAGFDHDRDAFYPASGLRGNLTRLGTFGLSIGVSSIAEVQIDGGLMNRLTIVDDDPLAPLAGMLDITGDSTQDIEDLSIGAKVRFVSETQAGPRWPFDSGRGCQTPATRAASASTRRIFTSGSPSARPSSPSGSSATSGSASSADPVRGDRQNDVLDYGISVARAVRRASSSLARSTAARTPARASRRSAPTAGRRCASARRFTQGPVRVDGALAIGVTERDPSWGFTRGHDLGVPRIHGPVVRAA